MRLLVCGGRDYWDIDRVFAALNKAHSQNRITAIIEGGAVGADHLARRWAESNGVELLTFQADWAAHGRAAGPLRNQRMLDEGRPDGVVAFPGGRGTADMVRRAEAAGIRVWLPWGRGGE
jgi:hypothetical protein